MRLRTRTRKADPGLSTALRGMVSESLSASGKPRSRARATPPPLGVEPYLGSSPALLRLLAVGAEHGARQHLEALPLDRASTRTADATGAVVHPLQGVVEGRQQPAAGVPGQRQRAVALHGSCALVSDVVIEDRVSAWATWSAASRLGECPRNSRTFGGVHRHPVLRSESEQLLGRTACLDDGSHPRSRTRPACSWPSMPFDRGVVTSSSRAVGHLRGRVEAADA